LHWRKTAVSMLAPENFAPDMVCSKNAQFRKAKLTGAKLDNINLYQGSLAKAHLVNASFKGANLYGVDFLRSTITNTDFSGSNLDTTLIEDWRPE